MGSHGSVVEAVNSHPSDWIKFLLSSIRVTAGIMQGILPALLYAAEIFHITHGHVQTFQRASVQSFVASFLLGHFYTIME